MIHDYSYYQYHHDYDMNYYDIFKRIILLKMIYMARE